MSHDDMITIHADILQITDAWEWQDEESTDDAPESAPENSSEGGTEVAPDAAGEEPETEEDNSTLAEEN